MAADVSDLDDIAAPATAHAVFSDCGRYRYVLTRGAPDAARVLWVMLNPSTADATRDDPTIRRCRGFAREWSCQAIAVVNLFAWRATDPRDLTAALADGHNIVGPDNARHIAAAARAETTQRIVVGWGVAHRRARERGLDVHAMLRRARPDIEVECLGMTNDGSPRHPLYVARETQLVPWVPR